MNIYKFDSASESIDRPTYFFINLTNIGTHGLLQWILFQKQWITISKNRQTHCRHATFILSTELGLPTNFRECILSLRNNCYKNLEILKKKDIWTRVFWYPSFTPICSIVIWCLVNYSWIPRHMKRLCSMYDTMQKLLRCV